MAVLGSASAVRCPQPVCSSVAARAGRVAGLARLTASPRPAAAARRRALVCRPQAVGQAPVPGTGLSPELRSAIEQFISENKVVAFIKGTKQFPSCGFSNTVVQILNQTGVPYVTVNVLEDDLLRSGMKEYSQWPTFPQVYINGEFYGGADIMIAEYTNGNLNEALEIAMNS